MGLKDGNSEELRTYNGAKSVVWSTWEAFVVCLKIILGKSYFFHTCATFSEFSSSICTLGPPDRTMTTIISELKYQNAEYKGNFKPILLNTVIGNYLFCCWIYQCGKECCSFVRIKMVITQISGKVSDPGILTASG